MGSFVFEEFIKDMIEYARRNITTSVEIILSIFSFIYYSMTKLSDVLDSVASEILEFEIVKSGGILNTTQCNTPYEVITALKKEVLRVDPLDPQEFIIRVINLLNPSYKEMIDDPLCFVFSEPPSPKSVEQVSIVRRIFCGWGGAKGQE